MHRGASDASSAPERVCTSGQRPTVGFHRVDRIPATSAGRDFDTDCSCSGSEPAVHQRVREIRQFVRTNPWKPGDGRADLPKNGVNSVHFRPGTRRALWTIAVIFFRSRLSAITIVAAMLVTASAPLFANEPADRACLSHQHDCSRTARLCCCVESGDGSDDATPAGGKTQLAQPVAGVAMGVTSAPLTLPALIRHADASTTAPRSSPPDLITLFGTFLI